MENILIVLASNILIFIALLVVIIQSNKRIKELQQEIDSINTAQINFDTEVVNRIKKERAAAVNASRVVVKGQLAEQMFPMINKLTGKYEMGDMIFIGKLFDYIIVDGYNDAKDNDGDIREVVILDVKTGNAQLSTHQEKLKKAIDEKRVIWKTIRIDDNGNLIEDNQEDIKGNE